MRVDSHQHFWSMQRTDYQWKTPENVQLHRDFLPGDLRPHLEDGGIELTVLVQAAETEAETLFMLDIAKSTPFVAGVVGWADMTRADFGERMQLLSAYGAGYLKGMRPMVQDYPDARWLASPRLDHAFEFLAEHDYTFDALVRPIQLQALHERLIRSPDLRVVVDHAAKPLIAIGAIDEWAADLRRIARDTRALCKLSGLVTEAAPSWTAADIRPYVDVVLDAFGPSRILWGSDWPVLNCASDYASWLALSERLLEGLSDHDRSLVRGDNAVRFYGLAAPT